MSVVVDAGDKLAEIDQVSRSHAVLTLVHLDTQPEPDPVSDVEPMWDMAPQMGHFVCLCLYMLFSVCLLVSLFVYMCVSRSEYS